MNNCCAGKLKEGSIRWKNQASCSVVLVSRGYPKIFQTGYPIEGLKSLKNLENVIVFHAGTKIDSRGCLVTSGGRVMAITAIADTLEEAKEKCYTAVDKIHYQGIYFRSDIAQEANCRLAEMDSSI